MCGLWGFIFGLFWYCARWDRVIQRESGQRSGPLTRGQPPASAAGKGSECPFSAARGRPGGATEVGSHRGGFALLGEI